MNYARSQPESDAKVIAEVRRFNRLYTRQLGLLDRHLLDSAFTLTEARVLYELAQCKSTIATKIAADLGLDLGYLSRILKMFERRRYIKRGYSAIPHQCSGPRALSAAGSGGARTDCDIDRTITYCSPPRTGRLHARR